MEFRTKVEFPSVREKMTHAGHLMLWGSCFTEHIGNLLCKNKFSCNINPFGILYNPLSIAEALHQVIAGKKYTTADLGEHNGIWHSMMHHSSFSSPCRETVLGRINSVLDEARAELPRTQWMVFTWGTARVYRWNEDGRVVGNCHKLPERLFTRTLLEVDEIVNLYIGLIDELQSVNPEMHFLFTVSPIRHIKDGLHGNQINKAVLLLAAEKLCSRYACCHYFPSYEIVMDELRDYRFYADDMVHPSSLAVQYIWECFSQCYFPPETQVLIRQWEEIRKGLEHRPFDATSEAYHRFISQILLKIESLKEKFPYLDVQNEIDICQVRLKK